MLLITCRQIQNDFQDRSASGVIGSWGFDSQKRLVCPTLQIVVNHISVMMIRVEKPRAPVAVATKFCLVASDICDRQYGTQ